MVTITLKTIFNEEVGLIILSQALALLEKKQTTPTGSRPQVENHCSTEFQLLAVSIEKHEIVA